MTAQLDLNALLHLVKKSVHLVNHKYFGLLQSRTVRLLQSRTLELFSWPYIEDLDCETLRKDKYQKLNPPDLRRSLARKTTCLD